MKVKPVTHITKCFNLPLWVLCVALSQNILMQTVEVCVSLWTNCFYTWAVQGNFTCRDDGSHVLHLLDVCIFRYVLWGSKNLSATVWVELPVSTHACQQRDRRQTAVRLMLSWKKCFWRLFERWWLLVDIGKY